MKIRLDATAGELRSKSVSAVRELCTQLAAHDPRLGAVAKSLWKTELGERELTVRGLHIVIENPVGSVRKWKGGETVMSAPYGYVKNTVGADGDDYDCFLGPDPTAPFVWIVHQARPATGEIYDEDKAMIGFTTVHDAVSTYLKHYDDPAFFGSISQVTFEEFCQDMAQISKAEPVRRRKRDVVFVVEDKTALEKNDIGKSLHANFVDPGRDMKVTDGAAGMNIAQNAPLPPNIRPAVEPTFRESLVQAQEAHALAGAQAIRRPPEFFILNESAVRPTQPLTLDPEYAAASAAVRAEAENNLEWYEERARRRVEMAATGNVDVVHPREDGAS